MTETDVEFRIRQALELVLPSLSTGRITHQKTFSLRLGHQAVKIDGTKTDKLGGRLDILLEIDGAPLAILEIKKPGERLDDRVTKQGLSYARALDNDTLPPLVITTNGQECHFYRTWNGSPWDAQTRDEQAVQALFTQAAEASGEDIDKAVQHLLETVPAAWSQAIRNFTAKELESLTGELRDVSKPIARDFNIPRKAMVEVGERLIRGQKKIAIIGEPFSGKTNLFANLCSQPRFKDLCFLYVDLAGSSEGIYDRIATIFTNEFFTTFTTEQVQKWITNQLAREHATPLVVLVDGLDSSALTTIRPDLDKLSRQANVGRLALVFAGHEEVIRALSFVGGTRQETITGRNLQRVNLSHLDDDEWKQAAVLLERNFKTVFEHCAPMIYELRLPRILRLLASTIPSEQTEPDGRLAKLWSICGPHWFGRFWDAFSTSEVREGFRRMAEGLLVEIDSSQEPAAALRSRMIGALTIEVVESRVPQEHRKWLIDHGFLQFIYQPNGPRFYLPKIPELLVAAAAQIIAEETAAIYDTDGAEAASAHVMLRTGELPYNGISCALALMFMDENRQGAASEIIPFLLNSPPQTHPIQPGAKLAALRADGTSIDLDLRKLTPEEIGTATMGDNMHPWLAASYLGVYITEPGQRTDVIRTIGSSPMPIAGLEQSPRMPFAVQETELPGGLHLLSGPFALLEPIIRVIYSALKAHPEEMRALANEAVTSKNIPLMHRLLHGAFGVSGIADPEINDFVMAFADELKTALQPIIDEVMKKES
jgi:hypothetical protein